MSDSARLAVDSFAPWRDHLAALTLAGRNGFTALAFTRRAQNGLGGTPPVFPVWLSGPAGVVAVEAQHRSHLTPKPTGSAIHYFDTLQDKRRSALLLEEMKRMAASGDYVQLDAIALIKMIVGLARSAAPATLLYLFHEPAEPTPESRKHRSEVAAFTKAAMLPATTFVAMSTEELWSDWEKSGQPSWLVAHAAALRQRYGKP